MIEFLGWAWQAVTVLLGCTVDRAVGDALVTMDDAIEAGILAAALRTIPELIADAEGEAAGPIAEGQTRWRLMALELWGKNHEDDDSQSHVGPEVLLPPVFAARAMRLVRDAITFRLGELGVVVEP